MGCRHRIDHLHDEVAVLQYTGGTTGEPKGAMLTHANLSTACSQMWHLCSGQKVMELAQERLLVVLPLFHIYALVADMLFGLRIGAELVLHLQPSATAEAMMPDGFLRTGDVGVMAKPASSSSSTARRT